MIEQKSSATEAWQICCRLIELPQSWQPSIHKYRNRRVVKRGVMKRDFLLDINYVNRYAAEFAVFVA